MLMHDECIYHEMRAHKSLLKMDLPQYLDKQHNSFYQFRTKRNYFILFYVASDKFELELIENLV